MALSETDITRTTNQLMREIREDFGCNKSSLRAAIAGIETYLEANASNINIAIPQPARGTLTTQQKAFLVAYVAMRRAGKLKAEED